MIPSFLLAKLYMKGSLKNTASGFEFTLKNIIDSTMLIGIGPINSGEHTYEGEDIELTIADRKVNGANLSRGNPIPIRMGELLRVNVHCDPLEAGANKITVEAVSGDIGRIKFDISDIIS